MCLICCSLVCLVPLASILGLFPSHSHKLLAVLFGVDSLFYYPPISVLCFPILLLIVSFYYFTLLDRCSFSSGLLSLGWCGVEVLGWGWGGGVEVGVWAVVCSFGIILSQEPWLFDHRG